LREVVVLDTLRLPLPVGRMLSGAPLDKVSDTEDALEPGKPLGPDV
jgi:hypothetical protein